jgi:hypothetical protein
MFKIQRKKEYVDHLVGKIDTVKHLKFFLKILTLKFYLNKVNMLLCDHF